MAWTVEVSSKALKFLQKLDKQTAHAIWKALKDIEKLQDPKDQGKGLKGNLAGFWRYRVGDYRIVCELYDNKLLVLVITIEHRSTVYRKR